MNTVGHPGGGQSRTVIDKDGMTLSKLRHDIRNQLNAIKLSCALLERRPTDVRESAREIDRAADQITRLVTQFLGDADAPNLIMRDTAGCGDRR